MLADGVGGWAAGRHAVAVMASASVTVRNARPRATLPTVIGASRDLGVERELYVKDGALS